MALQMSLQQEVEMLFTTSQENKPSQRDFDRLHNVGATKNGNFIETG